ncbi:MAG TPA: hypothetical protein VK447_01045 [Myxococcaceae bacterium]|nr:hypothetical protein [Myxococcaceae bacterium]
MQHGTLTIVTKIQNHARDEVQRCLDRIDQALMSPSSNFFQRMPGLHFARWGIITLTPPGAEEAGGGPSLYFGADFGSSTGCDADAIEAEFIDQLVDAGGELVRQLYEAARGRPSSAAELKEYLKQEGWRRKPRDGRGFARNVSFVYRAATAESLQQLLQLREAVEEILDDPALRRVSGQRLLDEVHGRVQRRFPGLFDPEDATFQRMDGLLREARRDAALATLRYLPDVALLGGVRVRAELVKRLRHMLEQFPNAYQRQWAQERTRTRALLESVRSTARGCARKKAGPCVQMPMLLVTPFGSDPKGRKKSGWLMKSLNLRLRRYLVGLNLIESIHCARWVAFEQDGLHWLLFSVTFDGSFDSYIDSFVENPEVGRFLGYLWGKADTFPGLDSPEAFKAWIEQGLARSQVTYSAYADRGDYSVDDLRRALRLWTALTRKEQPAYAQDAIRFLQTGRFPPEPILVPIRELVGEVLGHWIPFLSTQLDRRGVKHDQSRKSGRRTLAPEPVAVLPREIFNRAPLARAKRSAGAGGGLRGAGSRRAPVHPD